MSTSPDPTVETDHDEDRDPDSPGNARRDTGEIATDDPRPREPDTEPVAEPAEPGADPAEPDPRSRWERFIDRRATRRDPRWANAIPWDVTQASGFRTPTKTCPRGCSYEVARRELLTFTTWSGRVIVRVFFEFESSSCEKCGSPRIDRCPRCRAQIVAPVSERCEFCGLPQPWAPDRIAAARRTPPREWGPKAGDPAEWVYPRPDKTDEPESDGKSDFQGGEEGVARHEGDPPRRAEEQLAGPEKNEQADADKEGVARPDVNHQVQADADGATKPAEQQGSAAETDGGIPGNGDDAAEPTEPPVRQLLAIDEDVTNLAVDAIVSNDDVDGQMYTLIASAIKAVAGQQVEDLSIDHGRSKLGKAWFTNPGRLTRLKGIVHVASIDRRGKTNIGAIRECVKSALDVALAHDCHSIAVSAFGTEPATSRRDVITLDEWLDAVAPTIVDYLERLPEEQSLTVLIVLFEPVDFSRCVHRLRRAAGTELPTD